MILCVTLNPCLDKTLVVPPWKPGEHQVRGRSCGQVVGGKGVNVARALCRLGQPAQPALFLGGEVGDLCHRLLRVQDAFEPLVTWTAAPTREILTVRTEDSADQTAFFDPNPVIAADERDAFQAQLAAAFCDGVNLVCDERFISVFRDGWRLRAAGAAGACARRVHTAGYLRSLSVDGIVRRAGCRQVELCGMRTGFRCAARFAAIDRGGGATCPRCRSPLCGGDLWMRGMVAAWDEHVVAWKPPTVNVVNPIGAGDAMTAGLIDALSRRIELRSRPSVGRWLVPWPASNIG